MAQGDLPLVALAAAGLRQAGDGKVRYMTNAARVMTLLWQLAYCAHQLEHYPTQAEYAEYWKITDRTAQREWALFRRAFPEEESPERLAQWLRAEMSKRIDQHTSALAVAAPPDLQLA
jgi:hypothetical protein